MLILTKIKIIDNDEIVNAIYIHDDSGQFHLFIDEHKQLRTSVKEYIFESETPIIKLML